MTDSNPHDDSLQKRRRIRYKGTHPRCFEEKYKELQGTRYAQDIEKVLARGQTPAGTHRPVCVNEIIEALDVKPGMVGIDVTLGFGGHAREILHKILPEGKLYGIDVDPLELPKTEAQLRKEGFTEKNCIVRRMNFAGLPQLYYEIGEPFDFLLADLGVSSMQIDTPLRGFSFKTDGPLDLRLNPHHGQPAYEVIKKTSCEALTRILTENSDEPYSEVIARALSSTDTSITTTRQMATLVSAVLREQHPGVTPEEIKKSQQRVFQALRIHVNDEFGVLDKLLAFLPMCLKPNGRAAILTFHSGEDRRVKKSFQYGFRNGLYKEISRKPVRPSPEERRSNPRSSCAKLRWAVKG